MQCMKVKVLLLFMCMNFVVPVYANENIEPHNRIVVTSILKCGTHLLMGCLELLGKKCVSLVRVTPDDIEGIKTLSADEFWVKHLVYRNGSAKILRSGGYTPIFIYRDPRDQVVSFAYHMKKRHDKGYPQAKNMSIHDIITDHMTSGKTYNNHRPYFHNVEELYRAFMPWMNLPNMLSIRFEDLVGSRGGGCDAMQLVTIKKIAQHIGIILSDEQACEVAHKLYGQDNGFFREGQIGSWQEHFTPQHKKLFKKLAGQLLIDLKYEKDMNW